MFLLSGHLLGIASEARDRAAEAVKAAPDNPTKDATVALIMAAAASEGFSNEAAALVQAARRAPPDRYQLTPQLEVFADALTELEEGKGSIRLKYLMASFTLSGRTFDKGAQPYQDFGLLVNLRDYHMHLKPRDAFVMKGGTLELDQPGFVDALMNRGLAWADPPGTRIIASWLNRLQTDRMAAWAWSEEQVAAAPTPASPAREAPGPAARRSCEQDDRIATLSARAARGEPLFEENQR
jgi:hypothetical protein